MSGGTVSRECIAPSSAMTAGLVVYSGPGWASWLPHGPPPHPWPRPPDRRRDTGGPMAAQYDVIIIGTGAGGGTLLHALSPTGKRILVLERGGFVPRARGDWGTRAGNLEGRYSTTGGM